MARGKDVVNRADLDANLQRLFDRYARRLGITGETMTRQQFLAYVQQRAATRGVGGPGPGGGGPRGGADTMADAMFRRLDQNGDGLLNNDEMPQSLRVEREKWDTNKDGFIDLSEYRSYFRARLQQLRAERSAAQDSQADGPLSTEAPEHKPVVYHAGKLPPGIPDWFPKLDTDGDGQIGLYEWKTSGRPLREFERLDRNGDGFLTIDEVMHAVAAGEAQSGGTPVPDSAGGGSRGDRGTTGRDMRPGRGRGPDRGNRGSGRRPGD
jgi:Ca2+-binding EF-hand superfamily protein